MQKFTLARNNEGMNMKITHTIAIASALLLAAGCAHEKQHAQYDESISPYKIDGTPRYDAYGGGYSPGGANAGVGTSQSTGQSEATGGISGTQSATLSESQSDNAIVTQVRESLERDAEIAPIVPNIQISANNGTIILSGMVQSDEQKRQIESLCHNAGATVTVKNQLQVSSSGQSGMGQGTPNANQSSQQGGALDQTSRPNEKNTAGAAINVPNQSSNPQLNPNTALAGQSGEGGTLNPTSTSNNSPPQIYQNSSNSVSAPDGGTLNPTSSSSNSAPRIYQEPGDNMGNSSSNALNPTSRPNGSNQIYQENNQEQNMQQQKPQQQETNNNNQMAQ
jgi:hypothetical protein